MVDILSCITLEHDLRLVVLAALLCFSGGFTHHLLMRRAFSASGASRFAWIGIASIALGTSVWCTHFIAMLAYQAKVQVVLDPVLTMLSLILPVFGFFVVLSLFTIWRGHSSRVLGGVMIACCVAGLHYTGMMAYRIDGIIEWDTGYVVLSVALASVFTIAANYTFSKAELAGVSVPSVILFGLGVVSLHFTGMTAMDVTPLSMSSTPMDNSTFIGLSIATALAGVLVIATGFICFFLDFDGRRRGYEKLLEMALQDTLTQLPNRTAFTEDLQRKFDKANSGDYRLAVVGIDLNRFKEVNDTYGHEAGDKVLIAIAHSLRSELSDGELIGRLGGDEFAGAKLFRRDEELESFIAKLENAVNIRIPHEDASLMVGGSIGYTVYPEDGDSMDMLRSNADLAMYRAKLHPTQQSVRFEASMDEEMRQRRELSAALSHAIDDNSLELHYQLQANAQTGEISGMEALLRWNAPGRGPVSPGVFIPVAEQSGLILRLGDWVLRRACHDAAAWDNDFTVAVNVSPLQLTQIELPQIIHQTLIESGLPPHRLEIELTETAIIEDRERSLHVLRQIKALGVKVALDDFGTGYSSLEILRSFPFDKIKLDRFFMAEIETSPESKALVNSVLSIGQSLSIPILAEGVENEMQLSFLKSAGCAEVQGFLLGRPIPVSDMKPDQKLAFSLTEGNSKTSTGGPAFVLTGEKKRA
tara:strand:+ start:2629 stop:4728 length:2100 start_codon:yes stop_codon:yes gene_type:complete